MTFSSAQSRRNQQLQRDQSESPNVSSKKIFVNHLDKAIDSRKLYEIFSGFGAILSCKVSTDINDQSRGYGYILFKQGEAADNAICKLNGKVCREKTLVVEEFIPYLKRKKERDHHFKNIFIKNFGQEWDDDDLWDFFLEFGSIKSCKVEIDVFGVSKGYGYVDFETEEAASKAVEKMNGKMLHGHGRKLYVGKFIPKSQRESELANRAENSRFLRIKNIDDNIDDKRLMRLFQKFGKITSCKVSTDDFGLSKGQGFIHFETAKEANIAMKEMQGSIQNGKQWYLDKVIPRSENDTYDATIFIKNFGCDFDDESLKNVFEEFGNVVSCKVATDFAGQSKGHGVIEFETVESAIVAIEETNGVILYGNKLYVAKFVPKPQREQERVEKAESFVNVYVKNFEDQLDDNKLKSLFEKFGTITSCKVMTENGKSRGFGFVNFQDPKSAKKAVDEMDGTVLGKVILYVAPAQKKAERKEQLKSRFHKR